MTWALMLTDGSGEWKFRLEVERWPTSWVTHQSMVNGAASPPRRPGLKVDSGKLKCIANIVSGELDVSGFACTIADLEGQPTYDLARTPPAKTWITADVTAAEATTIAVRSTAGFASSGTIWLDSEAIHYASTDATHFLTLTRGGYGSLAQAHYIGAGGALRYPEVTDLPVTMARCRARLYAYGQHDDPTGTGTQIWTGVVARHPTRKGAAWSISVDPITSVLTRAVSADLAEPVFPRGIYYPWNQPFYLAIYVKTAGTNEEYTHGDADVGKVVFPASAGDTAFFETQAAFCAYLTTKLATAMAAIGASNVVEAVDDGADGWHLQMTTPSSGARGVWFNGPGGIDPIFTVPQDEVGDPVDVVAASTTYSYRASPASLPGAGSVPRGYYGDVYPAGEAVTYPELSALFPKRRIYVGGAASISSLTTAAAVAWKAYGASPEVDETAEVIDTDVGDRWVELSRVSLPSIANYGHGFVAGSLPEIRLGRTYATDGSIWTALSAMIAAGPDEINAGSVPDLRSGDFDSSAWTELDALWQPRIIRSRTFHSFAVVTVGDLVKEELKLAGYALGLSATGTIAPFRLRRPLSTEAGAVAVPGFQINKGVPTWDPSGLGMVNQVLIRRGYDAASDEYLSSTDIVRDVAAFGQSPQPRTLKIEPKSRPTAEIESHQEIVEVSARLFSLLAYPYAIVHGDQGLRQFLTLTGSTVAITSPHLPNHSDGTVGVEDLGALVIGRELDLSSRLIGSTYYVPLQRVAGYCPSAKVVSQVNTSGNKWSITVDTYTFDGSDVAADRFLTGDRVRVVRWDSTTPGTVVGTVYAGSAGNVVRVDFDGVWTPSSDTWYLTYAVSDDASLQATQLIYAYMAGSTGRIDAATDLDAWGFA